MDTRIGHLERSTAQDRPPEIKNPEATGSVALHGVGARQKVVPAEPGDFFCVPYDEKRVEIVHYHTGPGGSAEYNLKGW